ncbi:RHS repeat-associated core domain-containing protein [Goodfellowiella coeruleoviolacea]|uniref:RHS repeat-associated core domain-containing protein n=1 Tax=Goodfellowiella coeruleoviolacea TaxID=334858 RepID=A0AAE3GDT4_9PSEU|nr:RHS repeat-associated core domain-containing protein [Goodfellowiella coeruleoviolacea]MCP2166451.1 RHS repeat-associated core domain-containing protein [Goodfellowiella coeruleoviolacea]
MRLRRRFSRAVVVSLTAALCISSVSAVAAPPGIDTSVKLPHLQEESSVPGEAVPVRPIPSNEADAKALSAPPAVAWPAHATAETDLPAAAEVAPRAQAEAGETGDYHQVGDLPVAVALAGEPQLRRSAEDGQAEDSVRVRVETFDQGLASKAGLAGLLLRVSDAGGVAGDALSVRVDYAKFANAYGGDYGSRLRLVSYPDCVLTTPEKPECRTQTPLTGTNDATHQQVHGSVTLPEQTAALDAPDAGVVLGVAAAAGGSGGTYKATSLAPSGSWSAGSSSGDFTYSIPMRLPPPPGGSAPTVSLGYSSGGIDGRTSATNNQASWVGDGWDLSASGYVERQYKGCSEDTGNQGGTKTGDLCWATDNATMVLNGISTELVYNASTGKWHPKRDDGSRIERLTGASNGDNDGEYWKVTATDGTQYFLGLNRLPGWADGKPETRSAWTVPVFGNNTNEPCNKAAYAESWCQQAWRWNLDYVVDTHGNVTTYYYDTETNHYGRNMKASNGTPYIRGGYLNRIEYGLRDNDVFAPAPARVRFETAERCLPDGAITCDPNQLSKDTANAWPDVPAEQICDANKECTDVLYPSFFTRKRLTRIVTDIRRDDVTDGAQWRDVDSWTLRYQFPLTGDNLSPSLWLAGITHTGHVNGTVSDPEMVFFGKAMPNRVDAAEGLPPITRYRVVGVRNEAGGYTAIRYSEADCRRADRMPANPETNTLRCFPIWWTPDGDLKPSLDWFHKYVVLQVTEDDRTGGSSLVKTAYEYLGDAAWHYDQNDFAKPENRTWSEWRGYGTVRTIKGEPGQTQSITETLYLRGMDGDKKLPNGETRDVWVDDGDGGKIEDHERLQGFVRETRQYNGSTVVSASINDPWLKGPTATQGEDNAFLQQTEAVRGRTLLADGSWRRTQIKNAFTDDGFTIQVDDAGDTAVTGDEKCTRTTYARNESTWNLSNAAQVRTVALPCDAGPGDNTTLVSDVRSAYDNQDVGAPPTRGDITRAERWDGTAYQVVSRATHDDYGRAVETCDAAGNRTTTGYSPASGFPTRTVTTTNPKGHVTTNILEPAWGEPIADVGPNGERTDLEYDPLGRLVKAWDLDRSKAGGQTPTKEYSYALSTDAPAVVTTRSLREDGKYSTSYTLYDGLFRERQTQIPAIAGGRVLTDTWYDSRGLAWKTNAAYYNAADPAPSLHGVLDNAVPNQTVTQFDALQRPTVVTYRKLAVAQWETTTSYEGDRSNVTPPAGGTPTTVITDAQGQIVERRQYRGKTTSGDYDATRYTYTPNGALATMTDSVGNTWRYEYDVLGRKVKDTDPDKGVTTYTYNNLDQLTSSTDARGNTLAYSYDELGRKTGEYQGSTTGTKLAEWTYDKLKKGLSDAATRFVDGQAYTRKVTYYDNANRALETQVVIPRVEGKLGGTYIFTSEYSQNTGLLTRTVSPAAGGLPAEGIIHTYNELGTPTKTYGIDTYAKDHLYSKYGETLRLTLGEGKGWLTNYYQEGTRRLDQSLVDTDAVNYRPADRSYTYDPAGNITRIADSPKGSPTDVQCFNYDYLRRVTSAFTPASGDCAATLSVSTLGGPAPYWTEFTYDPTGNRTSEVKHTREGDTTRTYTYPEPGSPQPHTLRGVSTSGPKGTSLDTFDYDQTGNTTSRTVSGTTQTLEWDIAGRLAKTTEADGTSSSNVYDADGGLLLRKDSKSTTLYLGDMELYLAASGTQVTGKRYYSHAGTLVAVRGSVSGLTFMVADHQGTMSLTVNPEDFSSQRRYFDPFGNPRGAAAEAWPDDKGFVGGIQEASGLTRLGARSYDSATGRFLSVDPVIDTADPQQINGFAYSGNSPVTFSDPSGMFADCGPDLILCGGFPQVQPPNEKDRQQAKDSYRRYHDTVVVPSRHNQAKQAQKDYENKQKSMGRAIEQSGMSEEEYKKAQQIASSKKTWWDVLKENAGDIIGDLIGLNDVRDCFTKLDLWACVGLIPWGKVFKLAKSAYRIFEAVRVANRWVDEVAEARSAVNKVEEIATRIAREGDACPNSFVPGTRVLLADGSSKPIEQVVVGDEVWASDPVTGESGPQAVVGTIVGGGVKHLVEITVDVDGDAGGVTASVTATEGHPFWLPESRRWVSAGELRVGSLLQTSAGTWVQVVQVQQRTATQRAHNLTINTLHTYHVLTGATPVLVHNCGDADDDLLDFADEALSMSPDVRPNVATKVTSADGEHVAFSYATDTRAGVMPPQTARAVANSGHHGGCGEVGCAIQFESAGIPLEGAVFQSVMIGGGARGNSFSLENHGGLIGPCPACQRFLPLIGGRG